MLVHAALRSVTIESVWASPELSVVSWAVAIAATFWILVPAIAFGLGVGGPRVTLLPDVGPPELPGGDASLEGWLHQLGALGFRPSGQTHESGLFTSPLRWHWDQLGTTRWLISGDGLTYVTLSRHVPEEPVRGFALTVLHDGGLVRTFGERDLVAAGLAARHQAAVQERGVAARQATVAEVVAADVADARPLVRKMAAGDYGLVVGFVAALIAAGYLLTAPGRSPSEYIPLAFCTIAGFHALIRQNLISKPKATVGPKDIAERPHGTAAS